MKTRLMGRALGEPLHPPTWRRVANGADLVPLRTDAASALRTILLTIAALAGTGALALLGPWSQNSPFPWATTKPRASVDTADAVTNAAGSELRTIGTAAGGVDRPPAGVSPAPTPIVPSVTPSPQPSIIPTVAPPTATVPPTPPGPIVHVVQQGENLTRIARQYGTTVDALVRMNRPVDPDVIPVGTRLLVPR